MGNELFATILLNHLCEAAGGPEEAEARAVSEEGNPTEPDQQTAVRMVSECCSWALDVSKLHATASHEGLRESKQNDPFSLGG